MFVFLLWVACEGISLTIQHTRLRRILTARIEAAFGRPVEVESYDFSLWHGPALDANSVTVGEDPRFGHEYFLRAESMTVRLRWASLLRGHVELGTLSLTRPSLNLVRNASGDWNLGEWLPQPAGDPSASSAGRSVAPVLRRPLSQDRGRRRPHQFQERRRKAAVRVCWRERHGRDGSSRALDYESRRDSLARCRGRAAGRHDSPVGRFGRHVVRGFAPRRSIFPGPTPRSPTCSGSQAAMTTAFAARLRYAINARTARAGRRLGHSGARGIAAGPSLGSRASSGHTFPESDRANDLASRCS